MHRARLSLTATSRALISLDQMVQFKYEKVLILYPFVCRLIGRQVSYIVCGRDLSVVVLLYYIKIIIIITTCQLKKMFTVQSLV